MASHAAQLDLNYAEPVMIFHILRSIRMLSSAFGSLANYCIKDIKANAEHCKELVHNSAAIVTCLLPYIGYKKCTLASKIAIAENRSIGDVLIKEGMCTQAQLDEILVPEKMVRAGKLAPK